MTDRLPCASCQLEAELAADHDGGGWTEPSRAVVMVPTRCDPVPLCLPCAHAYAWNQPRAGRWRWLTTVVHRSRRAALLDRLARELEDMLAAAPGPHDCRATATLFQDEGALGYCCSRCGRVIADSEWGA